MVTVYRTRGTKVTRGARENRWVLGRFDAPLVSCRGMWGICEGGFETLSHTCTWFRKSCCRSVNVALEIATCGIKFQDGTVFGVWEFSCRGLGNFEFTRICVLYCTIHLGVWYGSTKDLLGGERISRVLGSCESTIIVQWKVEVQRDAGTYSGVCGSNDGSDYSS